MTISVQGYKDQNPDENYWETTLLAQSTVSANGTGSAIIVPRGANFLRAVLLIEGTVTGTTPTLDMSVEDSLDGVTWNTVITFAQKIATGHLDGNAVLGGFGNLLRVRYFVGGTSSPSFPVEVKALLRRI